MSSPIPCHKHHLSESTQALYIEQATIENTHPTRTGRNYAEYDLALILVGERHAKHDLVDLVGHLLATRRAADAR